MDVRVISIGALGAHPLRSESGSSRTGHATTSLVQARDRRIIIDPGLPGPALMSRLDERAGLSPDDITDVFLTSFQPEVFRGIELFEGASWWVTQTEREELGVPLIAHLKKAMDEGDEALQAALEVDVTILNRCAPAPDTLVDGVDLFPLPGVTPGLSGLLLKQPTSTTLICGDAIPTIEHLEQGKVLPRALDVDRARESFTEAIEIADVLILGRDNLVPNPTQRPF